MSEQAAECDLMLAHGATQDAIEWMGAAAGVSRQMYHRWPFTKEYLDKIDMLLAKAIDRATDAQQRVRAELARGQHGRTARNRGRDERRD